jgi:hypothetical protein
MTGLFHKNPENIARLAIPKIVKDFKTVVQPLVPPDGVIVEEPSKVPSVEGESPIK